MQLYYKGYRVLLHRKPLRISFMERRPAPKGYKLSAVKRRLLHRVDAEIVKYILGMEKPL